jgi:fructose-bisphosphate aldolase, class II
MLARPHELIADALSGGYAIGAFNTSNLELTQAIISAAQNRRSPVIVQTSEGAIEYAGLSTLSAMVEQLAKQCDVPVVLHLDHGKSLDVVKRCLAAGYTSVMIDASSKPIEENIEMVKQVVDYAHGRGIWVEAELGMILGTEGAFELDGKPAPNDSMTDPKQAARFVDETGTDALAVSVGTIHGAFTGQEYIRFELLQKISQAVPEVPLVLHGASGIADGHLETVAKTTVCKLNVDTEMRIAFEQAIKAYFGEPQDRVDPRAILRPARDAVQAVVEGKMKVFGSDGKIKV